MTTQVMIINKGTVNVKVEVQGRDENGRFSQVDEKILEPGKYADVWITDTQSFQVIEAKKEA